MCSSKFRFLLPKSLYSSVSLHNDEKSKGFSHPKNREIFGEIKYKKPIKMKKFAIAMFALLICAVILPSVLASQFEVSVNGIAEYWSPICVKIGDTVPVKIAYNLDMDASDVVVEAQLYYGHGKEVTASTEALDAVAGITYTDELSIKIPSDIDTASPGETYTLYVRLKDKKDGTLSETEFPVQVQRSNDLLEIQKVMKTTAESGKSSVISVVVKNVGADLQEDVYVKVSIPELGISAPEERIGDLVAVDDGDKTDTATANVYLSIPSNAADGTYSMIVTVYNDNVEVSKTESLKVKGVAGTKVDASEVVPQILSQEVGQGKSVSYGLIIGNLADSVQTYSVDVSGTEGWATYAVTPLKVTLNGKDSQVVNVMLTADKNAIAGQHTFTVAVKNGDQVVKQFTMTASVKASKTSIDAMLISVIVLAVILVILILVLVKSKKSESTNTEESYY
jgi:hypothetical protein